MHCWHRLVLTIVPFVAISLPAQDRPVLSVSCATQTNFQLQISGRSGALYGVETSPNLSQWTRSGTALSEAGVTTVTCSEPNHDPLRFFRVLADSPAHQLVQTYCSRAQVSARQAKLDLYQFATGLEELGVLSNLVDFAFFSQGMQPAVGPPVSWRNLGVQVGDLEHLRGGLRFPNHLRTDHFFFTNLPPTPNGRTLVLWAAGNLNSCGVSQDSGIALIEMTAKGPWPQAMAQMFYSNGGYSPYNWNGQVQRFGSDWYGWSGHENSLFCLGMSSSVAGYEFCLNRDNYAGDDFDCRGYDNTSASPAVIRFGIRCNSQPQSGWNGIYRGFAYFNTVLNRAQVMQIDELVPRVGLIIEGDSKSVVQAPSVYWQWWLNIPQAWGLYAIRTNSAVSGTRVAASNCLIGTSMESRFPADSLLRTNAQFPVILYSLRGAHNDFINTNSATLEYTENAFSAVTNLWGSARAAGFKVVGWTIDRTAVTWSGGDPGNSNMLMLINGRLREHEALCDYLVDNEAWYVANFGQTPFTNSLLYRDGVHDCYAAPILGTNMLAQYPWPGLGYDTSSKK